LEKGWEMKKKGMLHLVMSAAVLLIGAIPSFAQDWDWHPPHHSVPEPSTMLLIGAGVAGLAAYRFVKGRRK